MDQRAKTTARLEGVYLNTDSLEKPFSYRPEGAQGPEYTGVIDMIFVDGWGTTVHLRDVQMKDQPGMRETHGDMPPDLGTQTASAIGIRSAIEGFGERTVR